MKAKPQPLQKWLFLLLGYTLLVILWGAWVRISHSGNGCGEHWPLCHGEFIPNQAGSKTWIEYFHRLMSGLYGIFVLGLFLATKRAFPSGHSARKAATWSLLFTLSEALLGAKLVLFGLVAENASPYRSFTMALHLINSLCLVASVCIWWQLCQPKNWQRRQESPFTIPRRIDSKILWSCVVSILTLAITGAIAALSTTLFPAESLLQGFKEDIAADAHHLVRLRFLHPLLGFLLGGGLAFMVFSLSRWTRKDEFTLQRKAHFLGWSLVTGVVVGAATLLSLSPIALKLIHLTTTYSIWIAMVLWIHEIFYRSGEDHSGNPKRNS